jgi:hypothetical protein
MVMEDGTVLSGSFSSTVGRMEEMSVVGSTVRRNWPLRLWNLRIMLDEARVEVVRRLVMSVAERCRCYCADAMDAMRCRREEGDEVKEVDDVVSKMEEELVDMSGTETVG